MPFLELINQTIKPNEPYDFHLKRIVDGKETVLTEREQERLRLYLAGAFDVEGRAF